MLEDTQTTENTQPKLKLKALVIDDSKVMRSLVMNSLTKTELADFEFVEAEDGSNAMDIFDPSLIEIVFADWNMPQLNGLEFARHIRAMRSARHIPIVMITSESSEDKQTTAYEEARISCYITKPFTVDDMKEKLTPIIEGISKHKKEEVEPVQPVKKLVEPAPAKPAGGFFSKLLRKG